jgi:hypothetical protein
MAAMRSALSIRSWKWLTTASGGCNAYAKGCGELNRHCMRRMGADGFGLANSPERWQHETPESVSGRRVALNPDFS